MNRRTLLGLTASGIAWLSGLVPVNFLKAQEQDLKSNEWFPFPEQKQDWELHSAEDSQLLTWKITRRIWKNKKDSSFTMLVVQHFDKSGVLRCTNINY